MLPKIVNPRDKTGERRRRRRRRKRRRRRRRRRYRDPFCSDDFTCSHTEIKDAYQT